MRRIIVVLAFCLTLCAGRWFFCVGYYCLCDVSALIMWTFKLARTITVKANQILYVFVLCYLSVLFSGVL